MPKDLFMKLVNLGLERKISNFKTFITSFENLDLKNEMPQDDFNHLVNFLNNLLNLVEMSSKNEKTIIYADIFLNIVEFMMKSPENIIKLSDNIFKMTNEMIFTKSIKLDETCDNNKENSDYLNLFDGNGNRISIADL